jgi:hypothetical protein
MSILNTISGASSAINIGGSALSLIGMGSALFKGRSLKKGIDGFLFDIPLTDNVSYSANITDHYAEDNSSIQDHIGLDPLKITMTGKIAELVYTKTQQLTFLSAMVDRLAPLGVFSPKQALQAQKAISTANQALSAIDTLQKTYNNLADIFKDEPSKNAQQKAFATLENMFLGRSIISVETPWKTYTSMAIESFSADQDAESLMETTFTISFKQMRFVGTTTNIGSLVGRIAAQKSGIVNKGLQSGTTKSGAASLWDAAAGK